MQWGFGGGTGPGAIPGTYTVTLSRGDWSATESFEWQPHPKWEASIDDYREQLELGREVGAAAKLLYDELAQLRDVKEQASSIGRKLADAGYGDDASKAATELNKKLEAIEGELTQLKGESSQDSLNFPGRLDQQFNGLYGGLVSNPPPVSEGVKERWADLEPMLQPLLDQIAEIYSSDLASFNELAGANGLKVLLKKAEDSAD